MFCKAMVADVVRVWGLVWVGRAQVWAGIGCSGLFVVYFGYGMGFIVIFVVDPVDHRVFRAYALVMFIQFFVGLPSPIPRFNKISFADKKKV